MTRRGQRLDATQLTLDSAGHAAQVWFCGPAGLARSLRDGLRRLGRTDVRWHQEAFQMR